jgi:SIR2-like protein
MSVAGGLLPPYRLIADGLEEGAVIPFLGAGASLGCRLEDAEGDSTLPSATDLSKQLASTANFPQGADQNLASVAQYYEIVSGRNGLNDALHEVFAAKYEPSRLHRYLASIERPLLIVTTNYDRLLETAFEHRPHDLVVHTTEAAANERLLWWRNGAKEPERVLAKKLYIDLGKTTVIYKMHGAVDALLAARDQYVITEDDYVDFVSRLIRKKAIPAIFAEPFQNRHFLFLGYGLRDWNFRVVLNRVDKSLRGGNVPPSWAIDAKPSALETRLWQRRGVEVYGMTIEEFLDGLGAA